MIALTASLLLRRTIKLCMNMRGRRAANRANDSSGSEEKEKIEHKKHAAELKAGTRTTRRTANDSTDDNTGEPDRHSSAGEPGHATSHEGVSFLVNRFKKTEKKKISHQLSESNDAVADISEMNAESTGNIEGLSNSTEKTTKKSMKRSKVKIEFEEDSKRDKWEPENWLEMLHNIREMRKSGDAPVDSMGCDKCTDGDAAPEVNKLVLILLIVISTTA